MITNMIICVGIVLAELVHNLMYTLIEHLEIKETGQQSSAQAKQQCNVAGHTTQRDLLLAVSTNKLI